MNEDVYPRYALPAEGGCRCGGLRFRITGQPMMTSACHCAGCQRMTGAPFSTTLIVPADGFEVTKGQTQLGGLRGPDLHHHHCPDCLSWVFTRVAGVDAIVNVRAVLLDDGRGFVPFIETCTSEKLPWVATPAEHSFETMPPVEVYQDLLADYAAHLSPEED